MPSFSTCLVFGMTCLGDPSASAEMSTFQPPAPSPVAKAGVAPAPEKFAPAPKKVAPTPQKVPTPSAASVATVATVTPIATQPVIAAIVLGAPPPTAPLAPAWRPEKASELLTLVQAFYDATADITAKFTQTYWNPTFASKTVTRGDLKLKKPGKMIWDYEGKSEPDYFADGSTMWVVEHDTRQVVSQSVSANSDLSAAMKFLFGGEHLITEFKVRYAKDAKKIAKFGDADHHVLELKPRSKNPHYKGLLLKVHATTGRVDAFVVYNQDGSWNHFVLAKLATNNALADAAFTFKVPKGYVESKE